MVIDIPARHCREYIYMIVRYKIIQDFNGICIAVKTDEQVFVSCIIIRGFVQKTVVYSCIKSFANIGLAHAMLKASGLKSMAKSMPQLYHNLRLFETALSPEKTLFLTNIPLWGSVFGTNTPFRGSAFSGSSSRLLSFSARSGWVFIIYS